MTSKEALINIRNYNTETIHDVGIEYNENPLETECNIIEKDLERLERQDKILEIIKKYGYKKVFELEEVGDGGYIFHAEDEKFIPKEDFKLLKEVLDNGKD